MKSLFRKLPDPTNAEVFEVGVRVRWRDSEAVTGNFKLGRIVALDKDGIIPYATIEREGRYPNQAIVDLDNPTLEVVECPQTWTH